MRIVFGVLSLVLVLFIVGNLAKKQLSSVSAIKVPQPVASSVLAVDPNASVKQQSEQIQQQVKQAIEGAMQQARPELDAK
jgi:Na+-transporting methylmalonyl-CoA/oxaloacetate decarboxylase gamma subunit